MDKMPKLSKLVATLLLPSALGLSTLVRADVLEAYRWQNRLVVVAAPSPSDPLLGRQKAQAAKDASGWEDHKLRLLEVVAGAVKDNGVVLAAEGDRILDRLRLDRERFSVVLVGLDGTVKLRQEIPISNRQLFSLIDAMPMRREELRLRGEPY